METECFPCAPYEGAWQKTVEIAMGRQNETGATILTTELPDTAYTNEYVQKALAELEEEGVDTNAAALHRAC